MTVNDQQVALLEQELGLYALRRLTQVERAVVQAYVRLGSLVSVARTRRVSVKTIEAQTRAARRKCGDIPLVQLAVLMDRDERVSFT